MIQKLKLGKKYKYIGNNPEIQQNVLYECIQVSLTKCKMKNIKTKKVINIPSNDLWIFSENKNFNTDIIFNAWDFKKEKMALNTIVFNDKIYQLEGKSTKLNFLGYTYIDYIPLQYTNNKDRYNNRIFDRDILSSGDNYLCIVYWDDIEHRWGLWEKYPEDEYDREHELDYLTSEMTKVGNLFEHPNCIKYQWENDIDNVKQILEFNNIHY